MADVADDREHDVDEETPPASEADAQPGAVTAVPPVNEAETMYSRFIRNKDHLRKGMFELLRRAQEVGINSANQDDSALNALDETSKESRKGHVAGSLVHLRRESSRRGTVKAEAEQTKEKTVVSMIDVPEELRSVLNSMLDGALNHFIYHMQILEEKLSDKEEQLGKQAKTLEKTHQSAAYNREKLDGVLERMRKNDTQMDLLRGQVNRRNIMLNEQRTMFYKELLVLKEQLFQREQLKDQYKPDMITFYEMGPIEFEDAEEEVVPVKQGQKPKKADQNIKQVLEKIKKEFDRERKKWEMMKKKEMEEWMHKLSDAEAKQKEIDETWKLKYQDLQDLKDKTEAMLKDSYEGKIDMLQQELKDKMDMWEKQKKDYEDELSKLRTLKDEMEAKIAEAKAEAEAAIAKVEAELEEVNKSMAEKEEMISKLEDKLEKNARELEEEKERANAAEDKAQSLETRLSEVESSFASAKQEIDTLKSSLEVAEKELGETQSNLQKAQDSVQALTKAMEVLKEKMGNSEAELENAKAEVKKMEDKYTSMRSQFEAAGEEISKLNQEKAELEGEVEGLHNKLEEAAGQSAALEDLKTELEQAGKRSEELLKEVAAMREEVKSTKERLRYAEDQVKEKESSLRKGLSDSKGAGDTGPPPPAAVEVREVVKTVTVKSDDVESFPKETQVAFGMTGKELSEVLTKSGLTEAQIAAILGAVGLGPAVEGGMEAAFSQFVQGAQPMGHPTPSQRPPSSNRMAESDIVSTPPPPPARDVSSPSMASEGTPVGQVLPAPITEITQHQSQVLDDLHSALNKEKELQEEHMATNWEMMFENVKQKESKQAYRAALNKIPVMEIEAPDEDYSGMNVFERLKKREEVSIIKLRRKRALLEEERRKNFEQILNAASLLVKPTYDPPARQIQYVEQPVLSSINMSSFVPIMDNHHPQQSPQTPDRRAQTSMDVYASSPQGIYSHAQATPPNGPPQPQSTGGKKRILRATVTGKGITYQFKAVDGDTPSPPPDANFSPYRSGKHGPIPASKTPGPGSRHGFLQLKDYITYEDVGDSYNTPQSNGSYTDRPRTVQSSPRALGGLASPPPPRTPRSGGLKSMRGTKPTTPRGNTTTPGLSAPHIPNFQELSKEERKDAILNMVYRDPQKKSKRGSLMKGNTLSSPRTQIGAGGGRFM